MKKIGAIVILMLAMGGNALAQKKGMRIRVDGNTQPLVVPPDVDHIVVVVPNGWQQTATPVAAPQQGNLPARVERLEKGQGDLIQNDRDLNEQIGLEAKTRKDADANKLATQRRDSYYVGASSWVSMIGAGAGVGFWWENPRSDHWAVIVGASVGKGYEDLGSTLQLTLKYNFGAGWQTSGRVGVAGIFESSKREDHLLKSMSAGPTVGISLDPNKYVRFSVDGGPAWWRHVKGAYVKSEIGFLVLGGLTLKF